MDKYLVFIVNEDQSKGLVYECNTREEANGYMAGNAEEGKVFSLEFKNEFGNTVLF